MEKDEAELIIDEINDSGVELTKWEEDFMESMESNLNIYGTLTDGQAETLRRIHEKCME